MNGENENNHFWNFNVGHVLILLSMLGGVVWWFVTYDRDFTSTKTTVLALTRVVDKLAEKVDAMDEHGTRFSQMGLANESNFAKSNSDRVLALEAVNKELIPRVERMDLNLQLITDWVNDQKHKK